MKKEVVLLLLSVLVFAILIITGCGNNNEGMVCNTSQSVVNGSCCDDANNNSLCDAAEQVSVNATPASVCGNNVCESGTENCSTCWKDCGACKRIVYIYVPRNFTLTELTAEINKVSRDNAKFTRDRPNSNNISDFLFFDKSVPRYLAEFMGVKYRPLAKSRWIVIGKIGNDAYLVNNSASLFNYVNVSNWYLVHAIRANDTLAYEDRISKGEATADYPAPPTGHDKEFKYSEWEFKNYTKSEQVIYDEVVLITNDSVESAYASIVKYVITYKYHEFYVKGEDAPPAVEAFKTVEETRLSYVHALSFPCGKNLVMTIYDYDYDGGYSGIDYYGVLDQINMNKKSLLQKKNLFAYVCNKGFANEMFVI